MDNKGAKIVGDEFKDESSSFLPLRGVRRLIDLAGQSGKELPAEAIRHEYAKTNGAFVPPLVAQRRARKGGAR